MCNENDTLDTIPRYQKEPFAVFLVDHNGTISTRDHEEPETRSDVYMDACSIWQRSPSSLAEAMSQCGPLQWLVHRVYEQVRERARGELDQIARRTPEGKARAQELRTTLRRMKVDPDVGTVPWLLSLSSEEFENLLTNAVDEFFASEPGWGSESDYFPRDVTAVGAATRAKFDDNGNRPRDIAGLSRDRLLHRGRPPLIVVSVGVRSESLAQLFLVDEYGTILRAPLSRATAGRADGRDPIDPNYRLTAILDGAKVQSRRCRDFREVRELEPDPTPVRHISSHLRPRLHGI